VRLGRGYLLSDQWKLESDIVISKIPFGDTREVLILINTIVMQVMSIITSSKILLKSISGMRRVAFFSHAVLMTILGGG